MLWRKGYETEKVEGFVVPAEVPGVIGVGITDVDQATDAELWMRLIEKDFPDLDWRILAFGVDLEEALPPSRMRRVVQVEGDWGFAREFCFCVPAGLVMVGPPTEDAWEEFAGIVSGCVDNGEKPGS